jgi:hypothetical protein
MDYREGKPAKLYTNISVSGSWTSLTEIDNCGSVPGIEITAILWASGSYTTNKLGSGSYGGKRANYPALMPAKFKTAAHYVSPRSGSYMQLIDKEGDLIYSTKIPQGTSSVLINFMTTSLVAQLPIKYFDSDGENKIVLFGKYR